MTLQDRLDAFKADFEAGKPPYNVPPAVIETMHRATAELVASGQAERARHAGDVAPAFTLADPDGHPVSSAELLAHGPLVLTFYRGVWCPYCNMELEALQAALPEIQARGAGVVAISPQTPPNSRKSTRQNQLTFPILSDVGGEVSQAFGLRFALPDYLIELYKGFKNDLPTFNGDPAWTLPMPARYVIGTDGVIAYAEVNPDYTRRPDPPSCCPFSTGSPPVGPLDQAASAWGVPSVPQPSVRLNGIINRWLSVAARRQCRRRPSAGALRSLPGRRGQGSIGYCRNRGTARTILRIIADKPKAP